MLRIISLTSLLLMATQRATSSFTYTMKNLDREKWQQIKAKAAAQGLTVRALIEQLTDKWLAR